MLIVLFVLLVVGGAVWSGAWASPATGLPPDTVGDGVHDDTAGLQAALDSGASVVELPGPPKHYLISHALVIHSGQTLVVDRNATVRLADGAHAHMLTNANHAEGDHGISVLGGIWDGNNAHQTCEYHETGRWQVPYDPQRYLGVLLQFNNVVDLRLAGLTLKDPETFGVQVANLRRFTIEDITFDYNMLRANMDGVHLHGNCHQGRIANLKGATNDDLVALNADDGSMFEMSRGPIDDIQIDGLWAENGYTAVRLLSAGSPVRRVRISNVFGSFRYYVVSFTHHSVHPGEPSEMSEVEVDGAYCAKPAEPGATPGPLDEAARHGFPLFWVEGQTRVRGLMMANIQRRERLEAAPPTIHVSSGAEVERLSLRDASVVNEAGTPLDLLVNDGAIGVLQLCNVFVKAEGGEPRGHVVVNRGTIGETQVANCARENLLSD